MATLAIYETLEIRASFEPEVVYPAVVAVDRPRAVPYVPARPSVL
jgi:hypothetical protein